MPNPPPRYHVWEELRYFNKRWGARSNRPGKFLWRRCRYFLQGCFQGWCLAAFGLGILPPLVPTTGDVCPPSDRGWSCTQVLTEKTSSGGGPAIGCGGSKTRNTSVGSPPLPAKGKVYSFRYVVLEFYCIFDLKKWPKKVSKNALLADWLKPPNIFLRQRGGQGT